MNTLTKAVIAIALALACCQVQAQVYKCKGPDGKSAYQQTPCNNAPSEAEKVRIWAQPKQADIDAAIARSRAEEYAKREQELQYAEQAAYQQPRAPLQRQEAIAASGPCPPGQVPLNASRADPSRGWSNSQGYVPLRCGLPSGRTNTQVTRTGPGITEPRRIQDQNGNWYNQPPGSSFATDEKTGKQCFVYGNFVKCN